MQRTDWAEQFAEGLLSKPLVREFVFRSPRYFDCTEKEVCDLILALRGKALLIQMKCQEDPSSRSGERLERWVIKRAVDGFAQLQGALRTTTHRDFWCNHPRRGRVDFASGQLTPVRGVVVVEHFEGRIHLPAEIPRQHSGVPVSYFTTNDFLNLVDQLRAFPELVRYLDNRDHLPEGDLSGVGDEKVFFEHYILKDGSFADWTSYNDIKQQLERNEEEVQERLTRKLVADEDAHLIEDAADTLPQRSTDYLRELPADLAMYFDEDANRKNYLRLQEELCDVDLAERRLLGMQFRKVTYKVAASKKNSGMVYGEAYFDRKPDFLYVFVSSKGVPRSELLKRLRGLLTGALAHFNKPAGMAVCDRDGESFEFVLIDSRRPRNTKS